MNKTQNQPLRLITIPASHYCEKARWALTKLKISYQEEPHSPPFHKFVTQKFGGTSTPLLITEKQVFTDSTDILRYLDSIASATEKLYPTEPLLIQQANTLENLFNQHLGTATRRWGYSQIIDDYEIMKSRSCQGVPTIEKICFPLVFPLLRSQLPKIFHITENSPVEDTTIIHKIFAQVGDLLADGRQYILGDKFSAIDITFAALAAPVIQPPQHPTKPRPLEELPSKLATAITNFRDTSAGKYVLRLYRERYI
ncbi:glutathione S-transferase [Calothrix sp. 336/3]|uniref:glutathione S-transferase n=1 Tax=Calothrix sp. 336/3 TaxID=1337936 RepID=UPI0004E38B0A|nr:glutathione S-transferase family protein [Calothrix sp. 336/3]AKG20038.1 glutathione S-transferase [Calothrix sp. 336/3]